MKKLIVITFLVFLLTGCDVEYNLKYQGGLFEEEIKITDYLDSEELTFLPNITSLQDDGYYYDQNETKKFEQTIKSKGNSLYDITLKSKYVDISYEQSGLLHKCFEFYDFEDNEDYYYISAYGTFYCQNENKTTISLISDKAVLLHNAEKVKGNKYSWDFSNKEFSSEGIKLQISKNTPYKRTGSNTPVLVIQILLLGAVGFLYYWMHTHPEKVKVFSDSIQDKYNNLKNRRNNKF